MLCVKRKLMKPMKLYDNSPRFIKDDVEFASHGKSKTYIKLYNDSIEKAMGSSCVSVLRKLT